MSYKPSIYLEETSPLTEYPLGLGLVSVGEFLAKGEIISKAPQKYAETNDIGWYVLGVRDTELADWEHSKWSDKVVQTVGWYNGRSWYVFDLCNFRETDKGKLTLLASRVLYEAPLLVDRIVRKLEF